MTKNASRFDKSQASRLTLVDRNGDPITHPTEAEETSLEYQSHGQPEEAQYSPMSDTDGHSHQGQLITLAAISVGCAAAAVAAGSYALWLSRCQAAEETLDSVHDLLETCRARVTRMEAEMAGLSSRS